MSRWSLRDRVPVEPLSDERLTRIERAVVGAASVSQVSTRSWRALWLLPLVVATAIALVFFARGVGESPSLATVPASGAGPLHVVAGVGGANISLGDATIVASADSDFVVTRPHGGVLVSLATGTIELTVAKRGKRPPLVVQASDVDVVVIGTTFSVSRQATSLTGDRTNDEVSVSVSEGVVQVQRAGKTVSLSAGQSWNRPVETFAAATIAVPNQTKTKTIVPPNPASAVAVGQGAAAPTSQAETPRPKKPVQPPVDLLVNIETEIRRQPVTTARDPGDADSSTAVASYRARMATRGDDAAAATYGLARLQAMTLGKPDDALRTVETYLKRFPRGAETEPALWLRLRLLCRRDITEECRVAAHSYVRIGSGGAKAEIAGRVTATR